MRRVLTLALLLASSCAFAEITVVDGVTYECKDGLCRIVDEPGTNAAPAVANTRVLEGYHSADEFVQWLRDGDAPESGWMTADGRGGWMWGAALLLILLGGLAMNLTPCVLPMVPINLMVIGRSASRGAWYGLGIALAYGTLGVAAAVGGLAFGTIQGSPWFNLAVAVVFAVLALALSGFLFIDLSAGRNAFAKRRTAMLPGLFAFLMGALSAVLAGACVAPVLIGVLVLTAKLHAEGHAAALALPFVLGVGMGLPWPFLGAGLKVLPSPGNWMKSVNRLFALVVFAFAVWYGRLAWLGFVRDTGAEARDGTLAATPETFADRLAELRTASAKPVLVDCWATWCKNCAAMDRVMDEPKVRAALGDFSVLRLQAEDMKALRALEGFGTIRGLPAFVIFGSETTCTQLMYAPAR